MTDERGHFERGRWVEPGPTRDPRWSIADLKFDTSDYVSTEPRDGDTCFMAGVGWFRRRGSGWMPAPDLGGPYL